MTSFFDEPQTKYLGVALGMFLLAWGLIKWVGRTVREQLGSTMPKGDEPFIPAAVDTVPPALVKQALERGLVTTTQLATMAPMERQFLFAALRTKLAAQATEAGPGAASAGAATAPPPAPPRATTPAMPAPPVPAPRPSTAMPARPSIAATPRAMSGAEFGLAAMPVSETLQMFCPLCGDAIALPAFPPMVTRCGRCGAKIAVREDEGGRLVLNVSPQQKPDVPRAR